MQGMTLGTFAIAAQTIPAQESFADGFSRPGNRSHKRAKKWNSQPGFTVEHEIKADWSRGYLFKNLRNVLWVPRSVINSAGISP